MVMRTGAAAVVAFFVAGGLAAGCKQKQPSAPAAPTAVAPQTAPPAAAPAGEGDDLCPTICERTRPLGCKRAAVCRDTCREMRRLDACGAEMTAVLSCFARQPLSSWECSEDGDAAVKDGFCDEQQGRFTACVARGPVVPSRI
jgi:hypothetical protein